MVGGIARDERAVQYEAELKGKFAEVRKLNTKAALHAVLAAKKFRQAVFMEAHIGTGQWGSGAVGQWGSGAVGQWGE